jgi:hypothetical protein
MMSGLLMGMVLCVCTCWFHSMVTLPPWLVSIDFGTCSYQCFLSSFIPLFRIIIIIIIIIICVVAATSTTMLLLVIGSEHTQTYEISVVIKRGIKHFMLECTRIYRFCIFFLQTVYENYWLSCSRSRSDSLFKILSSNVYVTWNIREQPYLL